MQPSFAYKENDWITAEEHASLRGYAPDGFRWILLATYSGARLRGMMFAAGNNLSYVLRSTYHKQYKAFPYRTGDLLWLPRDLEGKVIVDMLPACPLGLQWHMFNEHLAILIQPVMPFKVRSTVFEPCCVCGKTTGTAMSCEGSFGGPAHYACVECARSNGPMPTCPAYRCTAALLSHNFVFDIPDTRVRVPCEVCKDSCYIEAADLSTLETALYVESQCRDYGNVFKGLPPYGNPMSLLRCSIRAYEKSRKDSFAVQSKVSTFFKRNVRNVLMGAYLECPSCSTRFCPICHKNHEGKLCYEVSTVARPENQPVRKSSGQCQFACKGK